MSAQHAWLWALTLQLGRGVQELQHEFGGAVVERRLQRPACTPDAGNICRTMPRVPHSQQHRLSAAQHPAKPTKDPPSGFARACAGCLLLCHYCLPVSSTAAVPFAKVPRPWGAVAEPKGMAAAHSTRVPAGMETVVSADGIFAKTASGG